MEFTKLLELIGDLPVFESALLLAGDVSPESVRLQLSRWTNSGKIHQIRRGVYVLAPPYRKVKPHPFLVANLMQRASYVSLQSALAFHGMIPEIVPATTSVTAGRPERRNTPLGVFEYRHIRSTLLRGYHMTDLGVAQAQQALVAAPEKALLDLVYLQAGGETSNFLQGLRLQNLERIDMDELHRLAEIFNTPKMHRAIRLISDLVKNEMQEYRPL